MNSIEVGKRYTFKAKLTTVLGSKELRKGSYNPPKVLLKDIKIEDMLIRDHTWVKYSKQLSPYLNHMIEGEEFTITFHARVEEYTCSKGVRKIGLRRLRDVKYIPEEVV